MLVCQCNFVERDEIIEAIREEGARTLEDIQCLTGASTSCGRCTPAVEAILKLELKKIALEKKKDDQ